MLTWWSLRAILMAGATTFCSRSMSANTHSSRAATLKSPLNRAWRPCRKESRLQDRVSQGVSGSSQNGPQRTKQNCAYTGLPRQANLGLSVPSPVLFFPKVFSLVLREEEEERERNLDVRVKHPSPASCAPHTGVRGCSPGVCPDQETNQPPFSARMTLSYLSCTGQGNHLSFSNIKMCDDNPLGHV